MRTIVALTLAVLLTAVVAAETAVTYEALEIDDAVVGISANILTAPSGRPVTMCHGRVEEAAVRFRYDGEDPTADEGELLDEGDRLEIRGIGNLQNIRFIADTDTAAVLRLTCLE